METNLFDVDLNQLRWDTRKLSGKCTNIIPNVPCNEFAVNICPTNLMQFQPLSFPTQVIRHPKIESDCPTQNLITNSNVDFGPIQNTPTKLDYDFFK